MHASVDFKCSTMKLYMQFKMLSFRPSCDITEGTDSCFGSMPNVKAHVQNKIKSTGIPPSYWLCLAGIIIIVKQLSLVTDKEL